MTVKDLCNDLGIDWKDGEDYSGVFFVRINNTQIASRINKSGVIIPLSGFFSSGTVLDLINGTIEYKLVEEAKPILCKKGDRYKTVCFTEDSVPYVTTYTFTGDLADWYAYHTGNMFPENSFLSDKQKQAVVDMIISGKCVEFK